MTNDLVTTENKSEFSIAKLLKDIELKDNFTIFTVDNFVQFNLISIAGVYKKDFKNFLVFRGSAFDKVMPYIFAYIYFTVNSK